MVTLEGLEANPDLFPQMTADEFAAMQRRDSMIRRRQEVARYYTGHVFRQHALYAQRLGTVSFALIGGYTRRGHAGREVQELEVVPAKYAQDEEGHLHRSSQ